MLTLRIILTATLIVVAGENTAAEPKGGQFQKPFLDATECVRYEQHRIEANGFVEDLLVNDCGRAIALLACRCHENSHGQRQICGDGADATGWYCQKGNDFFGNYKDADDGSGWHKEVLAPGFPGPWEFQYAACTVRQQPDWKNLKRTDVHQAGKWIYAAVEYEDLCLRWVHDVSVIVRETGKSPRYLASIGKLPKFNRAALKKQITIKE